jgi:hypothetical protein
MKEETKTLFRFIAVALPFVFMVMMSCNQNGPTGIRSDRNLGDRTAYTSDTILPGDFRTYGQGGWGAPPHGNNPGAYLRDNWFRLDTVIIGCDTVGGKTLTFTTWQAVNQFLPQGGKPAALDSSYVNPNFRINVLAGQVLALALNIEFDLADSTFGNSNNHLKDLCVAYGTFENWTVEEVFEEAGKILGGCSSNYSASQINDAVSKINENFEDGMYVGDYLKYCSPPKKVDSFNQQNI